MIRVILGVRQRHASDPNWSANLRMPDIVLSFSFLIMSFSVRLVRVGSVMNQKKAESWRET